MKCLSLLKCAIIVSFVFVRAEGYASNTPNEETDSTLRQLLQAERIDKWAIWDALITARRGTYQKKAPETSEIRKWSLHTDDVLMADDPREDNSVILPNETDGIINHLFRNISLQNVGSEVEYADDDLGAKHIQDHNESDNRMGKTTEAITNRLPSMSRKNIEHKDVKIPDTIALDAKSSLESSTQLLLPSDNVELHSTSVGNYTGDDLVEWAENSTYHKHLADDGSQEGEPRAIPIINDEVVGTGGDDGGGVNDDDFDLFDDSDVDFDQAFNDDDFSDEDIDYVDDGKSQDPPKEPVGSSLAFIFDSTGSMQDELNQVKVGAAQILASLLANDEIVIHNFILVPFNDPDIGPVTVTRNHEEFKDRIADISVHGGGDCPEMSVSGLKKALSVARPNSFFYVFTDASAKDYHLQDEVMGLIQQHQAQVVIIMTDTCDDENTEHYAVYDRLAAASSGQVYHLSKSEVSEVLKYVKVSLRRNKVSLLSLNKPAPAANTSDNHVVVVDETIKEFTVSVSGKNAGISVEDPSGIKREGPPSVETLLTLQNVKILNVKEPDPGQWQVHINSESDYTVRASGRSEVRFSHGFSITPTDKMTETYHRPLQGASCYLLIQTSDSETVYNLTTVDIVGLSGSVLQRLPLIPVPGAPGVFSAANFTPPAEFFHLGISGVGKDGYPIKRITGTAISPSLPEKPRITMRPKVVGRIHEPVTLICHVTSLVPFTVQWYKEGRLTLDSVQHPQSSQVEFKIDRLNENQEGNYTCHIKNTAGVEWKTTYLAVVGNPPTVIVTPRITAVARSSVELSCAVNSKLQASVKWTQLTAPNKYSGILHPVLRGKVYTNHSLILPSVAVEDEGWYICTAENKAGKGEARSYLSIRDPVGVSVTPNNMTFLQGHSVRITCTGRGKPEPKLEWRRDHVAITRNDNLAHVDEINEQLILALEFMTKERAGTYSCVATNDEESAIAHAELLYREKPDVKAVANNVMVKVGASSTLECIASGIPEPVISWKRNDQDFMNNPRYMVNDSKLIITNTQPSDAGEFSCIADNEWGRAFDYIGLFVGSPPSFLQRPRDKKIQLFHNGTVFCGVTGSPQPDTNWERVDAALNTSRMFVLASGGLRIIHADLTDAGRYRCLARNVFGNVSAEVSVFITGTEKPSVDRNMELSEVKVLAGGDVSLPCGIALGNPPGHVTWLHNGQVLNENQTVGRDGRLKLSEVHSKLGGKFECVVRNAIGNVSRTIHLNVLEGPKISEGEEKDEVISKIGENSVLVCPISGNPTPKIAWFKEGSPVVISSTTFQNAEGNLVFEKVKEEQGGVYVCTGTNELGSTSMPVTFSVHVPPTILKGTDVPSSPHEVVEGHMVVLNCQMHAVPTPEVVWFKDGIQIPADDDKILFSLHVSHHILRFPATIDDSGVYKCSVRNEAGNATRQFTVNILVPPRIADPGDEPIQARAGEPITLRCEVAGVPTPDVLWRRGGTYLTTNTSELTLLGSVLIISVVTEDAAGAYVCDAENTAGITQRTFYLQVAFPPRIVEQHQNSTTLNVTVREGEEFSQTCIVEGNPKPRITWFKDGMPLHPYQPGIIILGDNTLLIVQVRGEHSGIYVCRAENEEGTTEKEFFLGVATLPVLTAEIPLKMEVNEGETLILTCPTTSVPPPNIRWLKDGLPFLNLIERGDEAPMKLSSDRRELRLAEAHPVDSGNYSCVATNPAGRTDATFLVVVLMTPHFEEFNHLARRTVLVGGSVALNCSVSGNPQPQVTWRKDVTPVIPGNPAGVVVSRDQQHLVIPNARPHHSGTYTCTATNKVNTREREFYVTVMEPPNIEGPSTDEKEVFLGEKLVLDCPVTGSPQPEVSWYAEDCDGNKYPLNISSTVFEVDEAEISHNTVFSCEAVSPAGSRIKFFNVSVLEVPQIEGQGEMDEFEVPAGSAISLRCKVRGQPRPDVTWLHNGRIFNGSTSSRPRRSTPTAHVRKGNDDLEATLTLAAVGQREQGLYTVIASNRAGFSEKHFRVNVAVPPKATKPDPYEVTAVRGSDTVLECPVEAVPPPDIHWTLNSPEVTADSRYSFADGGRKLAIADVGMNDTGDYGCLAKNPAGLLNLTVKLLVLEPPSFSGEPSDQITRTVGEDVDLKCSPHGFPQPYIIWLKGSHVISVNESNLTIRNSSLSDAGIYTCVATNVAGAAEMTVEIKVSQPPVLNSKVKHELEIERSVSLHRRLRISCPFSGHPQPHISWFKNDDNLMLDKSVLIVSHGVDLIILRAGPEHIGEYRCLAQNEAGNKSLTFHVSVHVSASWTAWSQWSNCSPSCGEGVQYRERACSFGSQFKNSRLTVDKSQCLGDEREQRVCLTTCEVDGGWSKWSEWGICSATCGYSVRARNRVCDSPAPSEGSKPCFGPSTEEEKCDVERCPAVWSNWSEWSECSRSCGGGERKRLRLCLGGGDCVGANFEVEDCKQQKCGGGRWLPWGDWSPCSVTCGKGIRKRARHCKPTYFGSKPCKEKVQLEPCYRTACSPIVPRPSTARLHLSGSLNGKHLNSDVFANLSSSQVAARALADDTNWFPYAPLLLAPITWSTAAEEDSADNGYSLTSGHFLSQSDITFDTGDHITVASCANDGAPSWQRHAVGEGMKMRAEGKGVDPDGALTVVIEVAGEAPFFEPNADVQIKSLEQDFVQVGEDTLMTMSEDVLMLNDQAIPFAINSSLRYENSRGTMPYFVEKLSISDIQNAYNSTNKHLEFSAAARIGKKFEKDHCPPGFQHNERHLHCTDIDECSTEGCPAGSICRNTWGSYSCQCLQGYLKTGDTCLDVNECVEDPDRCQHSCINSVGSYSCLCSSGFVLGSDGASCLGSEESSDESLESHPMITSVPTNVKLEHCPSGFESIIVADQILGVANSSCVDIDECSQNSDPCGPDAFCFNLIGSFQCLDISCPPSYHRVVSSTTCTAECESSQCRHGSKVAESVIFAFLPVASTDFRPFADILKLEVEEKSNVERRRAKLVDGDALRIRTTQQGATLYAPSHLHRNNLYRVVAEVQSFGSSDELLYSTEFVVYLTLI